MYTKYLNLKFIGHLQETPANILLWDFNTETYC